MRSCLCPRKIHQFFCLVSLLLHFRGLRMHRVILALAINNSATKTVAVESGSVWGSSPPSVYLRHIVQQSDKSDDVNWCCNSSRLVRLSLGFHGRAEGGGGRAQARRLQWPVLQWKWHQVWWLLWWCRSIIVWIWVHIIFLLIYPLQFQCLILRKARMSLLMQTFLEQRDTVSRTLVFPLQSTKAQETDSWGFCKINRY